MDEDTMEAAMDHLEKMRGIDIDSIRKGDIICTQDGVLMDYGSTPVILERNGIKYEIQIKYTEGIYRAYIYLPEKQLVNLSRPMTASEVDSMIRERKLKSLGI